jgi:alanine dehydrogenase
VCEVKEPQPSEYALMREDQVIFTYLHLAAEPEVTEAVIASRCIAIAYETVRLPDGSLPLLAPMSEVAGRMAVEEGAHFLKRPGPGRGVLLGGIAGVPPAHVVVVGSGNVGRNAVRIAVGMGARVTVVGNRVDQLRDLDHQYVGRIATAISSPAAIAELLRDADLVIGAVLVPGGRAPVVVTEAMVRTMKQGAVIVDCAVDQGGCIETIHETTHADPVYQQHGVLHYAVGNIPAAVPHTSTYALTNATLPYALAIAVSGVADAVVADEELAAGVNTVAGNVTNAVVAEAIGQPFTPLGAALAA